MLFSDSLSFWLYLKTENEDWCDCPAAQADLNLRWAHMSESTFTDIVALIYDSDLGNSHILPLRIASRMNIINTHNML